MRYTLFFPTPWEDVDPFNDNIDVCLRFEDGRAYTFVVSTPDNLKYRMQQGGISYLQPGLPMLFVEELTEENIRHLVQALLEENEALLRIYGCDLQCFE